MAELVGGFIMPHAPFACSMPDAPPREQTDAIWAAFRQVRRRIAELNVDTVVVIGDDHYTIHSPKCIPSCLIGIGDVSGPIESWLTVPRSRMRTNPELAQHIMSYGHGHGVDWACAKTMVLDHSCYVPWHYAIRDVPDVAMIPVYLNSGVEPIIPTRRAFEIGQSIAAAIACWDDDSRVAIYGTGGVSHWPGMPQMGAINEDWDRRLIEMVRTGDAHGLIAMSDADILAEGGNGGLELKNWVCAMGAMGSTAAHIIEYQAVYEWVCGCAFAELGLAA